MSRYIPPRASIFIILFMVGGPLIWIFPYFYIGHLIPGTDFYPSESEPSVTLAALGALLWLTLALQERFAFITVIPTFAASVLSWIVAHQLSRYSFNHRAVWSALIMLSAGIVSGLTFSACLVIALMIEAPISQQPDSKSLLLHVAVVAFVGLALGLVLSLLSKRAPNNSFKPNPLRGSA